MTAGTQETQAALPRHRLPAGILRGLARGAGGVAAVTRLVVAQHSKNVLAIRWLAELAEDVGHPQAALTRAALDALARLEGRAPEAVHRTLRDPMIGAWAMRTALRLHRAPSLTSQPGHLASVAVSAAARAGVPLSITLPGPVPGQHAVDLPTLGRAHLPPPRSGEHLSAIQARVEPGGRVELAYGAALLSLPTGLASDTPGWTTLPRFETASAGLAMRVRFDGTALAWPDDDRAETDPPSRADLLRLDAADRATLHRWHQRLAGGWDLLVRQHRRVAAETAAAITVIAPLRPPASGQSSGTFRGAFGCFALSLPPDDVTAAVTLAHEIQHAKLAALMDLVPLVRPGEARLFYAPWRDDPRPVTGLLHGLYAHLGVAGFWRRHLRAERPGQGRALAEVEYLRWRDACRQVAGVLRREPALTPTGEWIVAQLADVLGIWCRQDVVSDQARRAAAEIATRHRLRWTEQYGEGPSR
ncbi:HEXXH motif domain-containing protein [Micromonospora sp. WMMD1102]|uniref:HEXXH motif domain-containing protein n=1 Tax=Micromonospora sp. WMMD1102 TaxID=3016105 RepID=UPI00241588A1|nr:HEXXH motif domain-containing protein [Micromonospora sp. WMMD1102]MDG4785155.1 HEXXH motif domain-containing protein [Micromonospora sp. WMMD1102]